MRHSNVVPIVMLAVLAVAVAVAPAPAGDCVVRNRGSCYGYTPTYSTPSYYGGHDYYERRQVIELATFPPYYAETQSFYRDQLLADAIAYRILMAQGGRPSGLGAGAGGTAAQQEQVARPALAKTEPTAPAVNTAVSPGLQAVVTDKCVKCHQQATAKNKFVDLSNLATTPELVRLRAFKAINKGTMPKGADPLPDANVGLFDEWADAASK